MNDFKKSLEVKCIPNITQEREARKKFKEKEMKRYKQFYYDPAIQNYFHHIIAAIMIAQNQYYEFHGVNIPYRFKASKSTSDKLDSFLADSTIRYNEHQEPQVQMRPILDVVAMKVISRRRPPAFSSTDPHIRDLLEEKKKNQSFIEEMQKFKAHLIEDEYTEKDRYQYKYECRKVEYYETCKKLLLRLKEIVDPKATNLIANYDRKLIDIDNRLELLYATQLTGENKEIVDKEDLTDPDINFFKILSEYENSVYNKSDLAILTKQFQSLFQNNKIFDELGISISKEFPLKEKRTENGFESNFIYIDTLFGTIECQLQTEDQYRSGNYGYAAHTKMTGKAIKPFPIPDIEDKKSIRNFVKQINEVSPKGFFARMDDNEPGRVMVQQFNDYQNYKNLISQVAKGDPLERFLYNYCGKIYALQKKIFKTQENSLGFIDLDIKEYIDSEEFKELKENVANRQKDEER